MTSRILQIQTNPQNCKVVSATAAGLWRKMSSQRFELVGASPMHRPAPSILLPATGDRTLPISAAIVSYHPLSIGFLIAAIYNEILRRFAKGKLRPENPTRESILNGEVEEMRRKR